MHTRTYSTQKMSSGGLKEPLATEPEDDLPLISGLAVRASPTPERRRTIRGEGGREVSRRLDSSATGDHLGEDTLLQTVEAHPSIDIEAKSRSAHHY